MATLVLTAVGTAIGGPVGGAIGALLGQTADRTLLGGGKTREGARLADLHVQTSSYGSDIPRVFGTMRVAGTVIWSTDLQETRATASAGKGQPSVATYSYAASFAVLLSGRPIRAVGRIWADGNLLRGAAGDFKVSTGFRLHLGSEDQPVDPLIAAAVGASLAPAHRGGAYAVFEGLQLADYGNRIPSLTFELVADDGPVTVGAVASELAPEVVGTAAMALAGFAAGGDTARATLDMLATAGAAWFGPSGDGLAMRDGGPAESVEDAGVRAGSEDDGTRRTRTVAAIETVPRTVSVQHYDPARDYQSGMQRARRPGAGSREQAVALPAALDAATAKTVATAVLARAEAARTTRTLAAGLDAVGTAPGDLVTVAGEQGMWRVREVLVERWVVKLTLEPLAAPPVPAVAADSGRVLATPDATVGRTELAVFEIPALGDAVLTAPRLCVAACGAGAGWRRAALLLSLDGGASWSDAGVTALPAVMGTLETPPPATGAALIDRENSLVVRLARADMVLEDADDGRLDGGANLALAGDELLQFARAEPLGDGRWRLSGLWRGRRGTEDAAGRQQAGDRFVLLQPDSIRTLDLPVAALGNEARVLATGAGDADGAVDAAARVTGASVLPPAPAQVRWRTSDDGAVVTWVRRSRAGWRWIDGGDVPLVEEREAYRATVTRASGEARRADLVAPVLAITAAERAAGPVAIAISQVGTFGESPPATIIIGEEEA